MWQLLNADFGRFFATITCKSMKLGCNDKADKPKNRLTKWIANDATPMMICIIVIIQNKKMYGAHNNN